MTVSFHSKNCSENKKKKSVEKLTDYVYLPKTAYQSIIKPVSAPSLISGANDPCNVSAFPTDVFLSARRYLAWDAHPDTDDLFMRIQSPSMKSMPSVWSAVVRFGPQLVSPNKIKKKSQSSSETVCTYSIKVDLWTGCTYGRKIKQLTFFCKRALSLELCN